MQVSSICVGNAANVTCAVKNFSNSQAVSNADGVNKTEATSLVEEAEGHGDRELDMDVFGQWIQASHCQHVYLKMAQWFS